MHIPRYWIAAAAILAAAGPMASGQGKRAPNVDRNPPDPPPALKPYYGPLRRAIVTAMEVKVQGVATTAPTPSGATVVVTLDIQQPTEFGTGLSDMLTTALIGSKRFVVLERINLDEAQKERAASQSPETDPAFAARTGRQLGAQVIIRGAVTEFSLKRSGSGVGGALDDTLSFSKSQSEAKIAIDLKLVDVATGRVIDSVRAEGKGVARAQSVQITKDKLKLGTAAFDNGPLGLAVRTAIEDGVRKICDRMEKLPWEAKIAAIDEEPIRVYLNMGEASGLRVGDILDVQRAGSEIIDPDTGLVIGKTKGGKVGRCRVVEVQPGLTLAAPLGGTGFRVGDVAVFVERPAAGATK